LEEIYYQAGCKKCDGKQKMYHQPLFHGGKHSHGDKRIILDCMLYRKHKYLVSLPVTKVSRQVFKDKTAHIGKSLKFVFLYKNQLKQL